MPRQAETRACGIVAQSLLGTGVVPASVLDGLDCGIFPPGEGYRLCNDAFQVAVILDPWRIDFGPLERTMRITELQVGQFECEPGTLSVEILNVWPDSGSPDQVEFIVHCNRHVNEQWTEKQVLGQQSARRDAPEEQKAKMSQRRC